MTPEQVREAADIVLGRFGCHRADCRDIAKHILTTVHADDHLPVTADWLRDYWGFKYMEDDEEFFLEQYSVVLHKNNITTFYLDAVDCDAWPHDIHTRHQFRMLAGALGIEHRTLPRHDA